MTGKDAITIRPAGRSDAADLAIIDNMASHGLSLAFWLKAVERGEAEDPLSFARERFADENAVFGWSNALVADENSRIIGGCTGYEVENGEDAVDDFKSTFPAFVPVFELFARAEGDWFVDSMGVYPAVRGRGIAGQLLDACLARGRERNYARVSLVVESDNEPAVRLYRSRGFDVRDSLPFAGEQNDSGGQWLLMSAAIAAK